jgi:hypothetical protein
MGIVHAELRAASLQCRLDSRRSPERWLDAARLAA